MNTSKSKVMLIDDDEVLRTLLSRVIITAGCSVDSCSNIKEALEKLKGTTPDLIILDLNMPELDGFTFLKFRLLNKNLGSIPVMVLSGTKNKDDMKKALALGANQFIEKPFEARVILQKLKFIFSSKEIYTYRFPESEPLTIEAEIQGEIIEQSLGCLKVESQVRFCAGKSVVLTSEDYLMHEGTPVVCRADSQLVELNEGRFKTKLTVTGLTNANKNHFEHWQRGLSK